MAAKHDDGESGDDRADPLIRALLGGLAIWLLSGGAALGDGLAVPWQFGFQAAASPVMERIDDLHDLITWMMSGVVLLVLGLLAAVAIRFNAARHPTPGHFTHNTPLEVVWTLIPAVILGVIAVPSFSLLFYMDRAVEAEVTVKATAHQWYWSYEYPDLGRIEFDSLAVADSDLKPGQPRMLAADRELVIPVGKTVRVLVAGADVIHSWSVPALGVKTDAVPGRTNETWIRVDRPGVFYGQCSQLCGVNHAYMPIVVRAVPPEAFAAWVETEQRLAGLAPMAVAAADGRGRVQ